MNRKFKFLVLSMFVIGVAHGAECRLDRSIPFSGSILEERYFTNVITSEVPLFLKRSSYSPQYDTLAMLVFEVHNNGSMAGFGGAKLGIEGKSGYIGFSNVYSGTTQIDGGKEVKDDVTYYWTRWTAQYPDVAVEALTELKIAVKQKRIISMELTHPVFNILEVDGPYTYVQFTGINQKLCVTSAEL